MALRMLHPIMPHITERVWQLIPKQTDTKAIIVAEFPNFKEELEFPKEAEEMELVFETITSLRNVRQSFNISPSVKCDIEIRAEKMKSRYLKLLKHIFNVWQELKIYLITI